MSGIAPSSHLSHLLQHISGALSQAGISCHVVAGACHDPIFVPVDQADLALATLRALQAQALAQACAQAGG